MAVSGGAFIPPIMGSISKNYDTIMSLVVLIICMTYLFLV